MVAELAQQLVQQRGAGGFAVSTRYAHQHELPRRVPVKRRRHVAQRRGRIGHQHVGRGGVQHGRQRLANNGGQPLLHGPFNELVAVGGRAAQGTKGHAGPGLPRVEGEAGDGHVGGAVLGEHVHVGEQGKERQGNHGGVVLAGHLTP